MSSSATPAGSTAPNPNLIALAKLLARIAVRGAGTPGGRMRRRAEPSRKAG